jgi:hypothetical protein
MKDNENKNQLPDEGSESEGLEWGSSSIFNDSYATFLGFDLVRHLPEEPLPDDKEEKETPTSHRIEPKDEDT